MTAPHEPGAPFAMSGRPSTGRAARSFKPRRGRLSAAEREAVDTLLPTYLLAPSTDVLPHHSMVVDIGFGDGETTIALATEHPTQQVLAIDVHTPGFGVLSRRLHERSVGNVAIIDADALDVVMWMCAPGSIAIVNVAFPDPWPKAGQQHRRLVDAALADLLASRLEQGGVFRFATDWEPYARVVETVFDADHRFERCELWATRPTTKYERKGLRAGRASTDLAYRRS